MKAEVAGTTITYDERNGHVSYCTDWAALDKHLGPYCEDVPCPGDARFKRICHGPSTYNHTSLYFTAG